MRTKKSFLTTLKQQQTLLWMSLPFVLLVILFSYIPLFGWVIAFKTYTPGASFFGGNWVGFKYFIELISDPKFLLVIRNQVMMAVMGIFFGTLVALLIAVFLNETSNAKFKGVIQTVSYLPHFVSWVVAVNLVFAFLATDGFLSQFLITIGVIKEPVQWLAHKEYFWWIVTWSGIWKEAGFGAIIYLAAMTGVDPQLYEAAKIDGAGRFQRIIHVTMPAIMPTVAILLIINTGSILSGGFEQQLLMRNPLIKDVADVFSLYILDEGFAQLRYSFATAAGIFQSVVALILVYLANSIAKWMRAETVL